MIEIIKHGTKTMCTCKVCGCLFAYEAADVQKEKSAFNGVEHKYIDCPQCHNRIYLEMSREALTNDELEEAYQHFMNTNFGNESTVEFLTKHMNIPVEEDKNETFANR